MEYHIYKALIERKLILVDICFRSFQLTLLVCRIGGGGAGHVLCGGNGGAVPLIFRSFVELELLLAVMAAAAAAATPPPGRGAGWEL